MQLATVRALYVDLAHAPTPLIGAPSRISHPSRPRGRLQASALSREGGKPRERCRAELRKGVRAKRKTRRGSPRAGAIQPPDPYAID